MTLFVGAIEQGYFIEEIDPKTTYTGAAATLTELRDIILNNTAYENIVIDVTHFSEHYSDQVNEIEKIKTATNANIIIMAVGFEKQAVLLQELRRAGIKYFILSPVLTHQKTEFQNALNGIETPFENNIANDTEATDTTLLPPNYVLPRVENPKKEKSIISIVGACERIGTTTQAIQIAKFLMLKGYTAAYVEMNDKQYVERLKSLYGVSCSPEDNALGKVTYQNVDMYYKKEKIAEILKQGYDYYIYDFGAFSDHNFNIINFLEKDISIIVGGAKPNEMEYISKIIAKTIVNRVNYIFNFCHQSEYDDILELMEEKAAQTTFAGYTPDPFLYTTENNAIYEKIIKLLPTDSAEQRQKTNKKHFSFFRGRG